MSTLTTSAVPHVARRQWLTTLTLILVALPTAVPILSVLSSLLRPGSETWQHLRDSVLPEYVGNTLLLMALVGIGVLLVGVTCAWYTATRDFPGRRWLVWALILPIAAPAYVVAYAYADVLAFDSELQRGVREMFGVARGLPPVRSLSGAAIILTLCLYPYVYLFAYTAFAGHARSLTDAARTLGANRRQAFSRVALPHARPAIAGGAALALMETAADFGVVDFFGVTTLTSGVFRTWYAQGDQEAALQLAGWLFLVVMLLVLAERWVRRGAHTNPVSRQVSAPRDAIRGVHGWLMTLICALPVLLGFVLPVAVFVYNAVAVGDPMLGRAFGSYITNTIMVAAIAAVLCVSCALALAYGLRVASFARARIPLQQLGVRLATLGYALPGMVLAVGFIGPLTMLDRWLAGTLSNWLDRPVGLLLTGSIAALIIVYLARFMTVAYNSCDSGMARIHQHYDAAARSLGASTRNMLTRVHLPMLMPSVLTAALLVFVDVVKELPATLILRPFNFETLATRAYRLASDERIAEASTACLAIVLVGLIPTLLLARQNFGSSKST
ncbi:MAG: iron ABC transporter permease [Pseudomonadota bacterium]